MTLIFEGIEKEYMTPGYWDCIGRELGECNTYAEEEFIYDREIKRNKIYMQAIRSNSIVPDYIHHERHHEYLFAEYFDEYGCPIDYRDYCDMMHRNDAIERMIKNELARDDVDECNTDASDPDNYSDYDDAVNQNIYLKKSRRFLYI